MKALREKGPCKNVFPGSCLVNLDKNQVSLLYVAFRMPRLQRGVLAVRYSTRYMFGDPLTSLHVSTCLDIKYTPY